MSLVDKPNDFIDVVSRDSFYQRLPLALRRKNKAEMPYPLCRISEGNEVWSDVSSTLSGSKSMT